LEHAVATPPRKVLRGHSGARGAAFLAVRSNPVKDIFNKVKESMGGATKPLMEKINIVRVNMCWKRPNLIEHTSCLKFLGVLCQKESTGEGICHRFATFVEKGCISEDVALPELKHLLCSLAHTLEGDTSGQGNETIDEASTNISADTDGDGNVDIEDDTPTVADVDGDGIPDVADSDIDGDGIPNEQDVFPRNGTKWQNKDQDGVPNEQDASPRNRTEWQDETQDGVPNEQDAFPRNRTEWQNEAQDGTGDVADPDVDGDGNLDEDDALPKNKTTWSDLDGDGIGDDMDPDVDGDGIPNATDAFPEDPKEWEDTDNDGVGDNSDDFPTNPDCWDDTKPPCPPAPVDEAAPGYIPAEVDKADKLLPSQGYSEHERGPFVKHDDGQTYTGDWRKEWPSLDESEKESITRICTEHPDNVWCRRYHVHGRFAR